MSYDTHKNWVYQIVGKNLHLWQVVQGGALDTVDGYKIRLPSGYYGNQLIYPDETIANGLMFTGTAFIEPFVVLDPNELVGNDNPPLAEPTTLDETAHVNVTRMLSLAIVSYVKAMNSERLAKVDEFKFFMQDFWKKVGDDDSNKRLITKVLPSSPYSIV